MSVTNAGRTLAAGLLCGSGAPAAITYLAYGTGATAFGATQTALVAESQRAAAAVSLVTTTVTNDTGQWTKTFSISGTETIKEIGAFNASSGPTMFARATSTDAAFTQKDVTTGDSFVLTYKCKAS